MAEAQVQYLNLLVIVSSAYTCKKIAEENGVGAVYSTRWEDCWTQGSKPSSSIDLNNACVDLLRITNTVSAVNFHRLFALTKPLEPNLSAQHSTTPPDKQCVLLFSKSTSPAIHVNLWDVKQWDPSWNGWSWWTSDQSIDPSWLQLVQQGAQFKGYPQKFRIHPPWCIFKFALWGPATIAACCALGWSMLV